MAERKSAIARMLFGKFDKARFKEDVKSSIRQLYRKDLEDATQQEIFQAVANVIETEIINVWMDS